MFSRRHPFLYFILVLAAIGGGSSIIIISLFFLSSSQDFKKGNKVGVVEITGVITESRPTLENLKKFRKDASIKAVVVRINSPGGAVGPSQEIYREIIKTSKEKKIVASLESIAASGGYYIATAADKIISNPGTITGSIGVIMSYTNLQEVFAKIGLAPVVIKSGEYKDLASPVKQMSVKERQLLQDFADDIHQQFIADVARGRNMEEALVRRLADGRIYTGKKAKELGLIDHFGNLEDAVELAGELAELTGEITSVYPPEKKKFSLMNFLLGTSARELLNLSLREEGISGGYLYRPGI